jgi:hypothetical protein
MFVKIASSKQHIHSQISMGKWTYSVLFSRKDQIVSNFPRTVTMPRDLTTIGSTPDCFPEHVQKLL